MLTEFETRFGRLDEATQIVGLKRLVPMELLAGKLRGERFEDYTGLRRVVVDYLQGRATEVTKAANSNVNITMAEDTKVKDEGLDQKTGTGNDYKDQSDLVAAVVKAMGRPPTGSSVPGLANSTAAISPRPRISLTKGWSPRLSRKELIM